MKKVFSFILLVSLLFSTITPVYAMENGVMQKPVMVNDSSKSAENKVERLNDRANKEINRRVELLNKLITKINSVKRLTPAQKLSFVAEIQTEISSLQSLSGKIKSDTDPLVLKADVQSVIKSYKVYLLFVPKIEIIAAADRLANVADEMSSYSAKLKTRIDVAKTAGTDVSSLETLLADMNAKIADAKTQASNAIGVVLPLTPDEYPGNVAIFQSARKTIQAGRLDLVTALQDGQKIRKGLKGEKMEKMGSESAKVTKEPEPTQ
mgnify:CR=1 FL=1